MATGGDGESAPENRFLTMMLNHCRDYKAMLQTKLNEITSQGAQEESGESGSADDVSQIRQLFVDLRAYLDELEATKLEQLANLPPSESSDPNVVLLRKGLESIDAIMAQANDMCENVPASEVIRPLSELQSKAQDEAMQIMVQTADAGAGSAIGGGGGGQSNVNFDLTAIKNFLNDYISVGAGPAPSYNFGSGQSELFDEKERDEYNPGGAATFGGEGGDMPGDGEFDFASSVKLSVAEGMDILVQWAGLNDSPNPSEADGPGADDEKRDTVLYTVEWKRLSAPRRLSRRSLRRFEENAQNDALGWETHSVGPKKKYRIQGMNPQTKYAVRVRARPTKAGSQAEVTQVFKIATGVPVFNVSQKLARTISNARYCVLDCGSGHANMYTFRGVANGSAGEFEMVICDDFAFGITEYIQRESFSAGDENELAKKLDGLLMAQMKGLRGFSARNTKILAGLTGVNRTAWNAGSNGRRIKTYLQNVCNKSKLQLEFVKISEREEADFEQIAALYVFRQVFPHMYTRPVVGVFAFGGGSTQFTVRGRSQVSISISIGNRFPTDADSSRDWFAIRSEFERILQEKVREHGARFVDATGGSLLPLGGCWLGIAAAYHTTKTMKKYAGGELASKKCTKEFVTREEMLNALRVALDNGPRAEPTDDIRGVKMLCLMSHWLTNFFAPTARFFYFSKAGEGLKATWSLGKFLREFEIANLVVKSP